MSYILRHAAEEQGIPIRPDGWCLVSEVLEADALRGLSVTDEELHEAVRSNDKKRFELLQEGQHWLVRASQGHSIKTVEDEALLRRLNFDDQDLPKVCVHGTYRRHLDSILSAGLLAGGLGRDAQSRKHVHFASYEPGDGRVISGMRSNCDVAIYINLPLALAEDVPFYISSNQVVLSPGVRGVVAPKYFERVRDRRTGQWLKGGD